MHIRTLAILSVLVGCGQPGTRGDLEPDPTDRTQTQQPTGTTPSPTDTTPGPTATGTERAPERVTFSNTYTPVVDPTSPSAKPADHLVGVVYGDDKNKNVQGVIHFRRGATGVSVEAEIEGLPAGQYAYEVHTFGDCSDPAGDSAGPALDFDKLAGTMAPPGAETTGMTASGGMPASGTHDLPEHPVTPGTPPGATGGTTPGATGGTPPGATGERPGTSPTATADLGEGSLGEIDVAAGKPARASTVLATLPAEKVGLLTGRSILVRSISDGKPKGEPLACGVIGVAGDRLPTTPTNIAPEQFEEPTEERDEDVKEPEEGPPPTRP